MQAATGVCCSLSNSTNGNTPIIQDSTSRRCHAETWDQFEEKKLNLAIKVLHSGLDFDLIVGVGAGGASVADTFSRYFEKDIALVMRDTNNNFAMKVSVIGNKIYKKALVLEGRVEGDDVFEKVNRIIKQKYPDIKIRTGAVFKNASMSSYPKYFVETFDSKTTKIILPNEIFDRLKKCELTKSLFEEIPAFQVCQGFSEEQKILNLAKAIIEVLWENPTMSLSNEKLIRLISEKLAVKNEEDSPQQIQAKEKIPVGGKELYNITWRQYEIKILALALKVIFSGEQPDFIVGVARGGVPVADGVSRILKKSLCLILASSYRDGMKVSGQLFVAEDITMIASELFKNVLLLDDLVESGKTAAKLKNTIEDMYPKVTNVRTGVVFKKPITTVHPNYFVEVVSEKKWIVFPNELGERLTGISKNSEQIKQIRQEKITAFTKAVINCLPQDPRDSLPNETLKNLIDIWKDKEVCRRISLGKGL